MTPGNYANTKQSWWLISLLIFVKSFVISQLICFDVIYHCFVLNFFRCDLSSVFTFYFLSKVNHNNVFLEMKPVLGSVWNLGLENKISRSVTFKSTVTLILCNLVPKIHMKIKQVHCCKGTLTSVNGDDKNDAMNRIWIQLHLIDFSFLLEIESDVG